MMLAGDEAMAVRSSGERLQEVLAVLDLSPYRFAAYWAGYGPEEPVVRSERGERRRRFEARKRSLARWLNDDFAIEAESAVEIVALANRLLAERGEEPFPLDHLVTPVASRQAGMQELRGMLQETLERLARIEERLS